MSSAAVRSLTKLAGFLVLAVFLLAIAPVLLPVLAIWWPTQLARGRWLRYRWDHTWSSKGRRILLVYSRSPTWQPYIETRWLPRLQDRIVTLDWSERNTWPRWAAPLEVKVFRYWQGEAEFNPMAIVFPERGRVRTLRFWQAFRDFKHGKDEELRRIEQQLFDCAAVAQSTTAV